MKNNSKQMFLVNFVYNEVCVIPKNTNIPVLHDWYPVAVEEQAKSLDEILCCDFHGMAKVDINDIHDLQDDVMLEHESKDLFQWFAEQVAPKRRHIFAPEAVAHLC